MKISILGILIFALMTQQLSFKETQLQQSRVKTAYEEKESVVRQYFADKKLSFDKFQLFLRAFKKERILEVWVKEKGKEEFVLLHSYDFCTTSGVLGPKRKMGDKQIPEGVYHVNHFNPVSTYYLSFGINYPNASDRKLGDPIKPGGNIYIHGACETIGCIPITDDKIKELYLMVVEASNSGQEKIPVHIFPARLDEGVVEKLITEINPDEKIESFWKNLEPVYSDFETTKKLRTVKINDRGEYHYQ